MTLPNETYATAYKMQLGLLVVMATSNFAAMTGNRIFYSCCPLCNSHSVAKALTATDFMVSGETFEIWQCHECTLKFTQNVPNEETIGPYYKHDDYISHTDKNTGLVSQLYKLARKFTIRSKVQRVLQLTGLKTGAILDIGCGTGVFLQAMQQAGWQATGLEPDAGARNIAIEQHVVQVQPANALFNLPPQRYDVITMWHVLEHVHALHDYLRQIHGLLKPGGYLLVALPNHTASDATTYQSYWAAWDVPRHLYHFNPTAIKQLASQFQFRWKEMVPMHLDAYYIALLSEKYRMATLALPAAFLQGLRSQAIATLKPTRTSSLLYILQKSGESS